MKTYPYQTPEGIIELVEKREYDLLALALHDAHNRLEQQLQDAVKRMEEVKVNDLCSMFISGHTLGQMTEAVRARLIQAAKGES